MGEPLYIWGFPGLGKSSIRSKLNIVDADCKRFEFDYGGSVPKDLHGITREGIVRSREYPQNYLNYIFSRKYGYGGSEEKASFKKFLHELKESIWALLVPIIILGGIYGGIFTPTEAAVVAVVYSLIIGIFVYKTLDWKKIYECFRDTGSMNGTTTFMVGLSMSFAAYLTLANVPGTVGALISSLSAPDFVILLLINLVLLIVGCFIDNISSTIILTPILLPIAVSLGMDPIQFGIVITVNLAIGFITPPYGVNLFYGTAVGNVTIEEISKKILPFIFAMLICLMLFTFIPGFSMFLPNLMK